MGWSEQYWEDVKSELQRAAADAEPIDEEQASDRPTGHVPATGSAPPDVPARLAKSDAPTGGPSARSAGKI